MCIACAESDGYAKGFAVGETVEGGVEWGCLNEEGVWEVLRAVMTGCCGSRYA